MKIFLYIVLLFSSVFLPPELSLKIAFGVIIALLGLTVVIHDGKRKTIFGLISGKADKFLEDEKKKHLNDLIVSILMLLVILSLVLGGIGLFPTESNSATVQELILLFFIPYCIYIIPKIRTNFLLFREVRK